MLWLTWRQHRTQVLVTAVLIAAIGVLLLLDAMPMDLIKMLPWAPVLVGLFWGVPLLVKEFDRGTHRLVWTQSVRRSRWIVVKLAGLGVAVTLAGLVLGAFVTGWIGASDSPMGRFSGELFGTTGVAGAAWFLAVFALGAAAGAVLRRMLPAMAVTIAVSTALVFGVSLSREYYAEPVIALDTSAGLTLPENALISEVGVVNAAGERLTWDDAYSLCAGASPDVCMADRGYDQQYVAYQPADRYWRFQWTETALLLVLTAAFAAVTVHRVVRRST
jgi:hypothetical protein